MADRDPIERAAERLRAATAAARVFAERLAVANIDRDLAYFHRQQTPMFDESDPRERGR